MVQQLWRRNDFFLFLSWSVVQLVFSHELSCVQSKKLRRKHNCPPSLPRTVVSRISLWILSLATTKTLRHNWQCAERLSDVCTCTLNIESRTKCNFARFSDRRILFGQEKYFELTSSHRCTEGLKCIWSVGQASMFVMRIDLIFVFEPIN